VTIELLHRGRFDVVDGASAKKAGPNAWTVRLPLAARAVQRSRRKPTVEGWDGVVLAIDGAESEPGVVSRVGKDAVTIEVWVLG